MPSTFHAFRLKKALFALAASSLIASSLLLPSLSRAQGQTPLSGRAFSLYDPTDAGLSPLPWSKGDGGPAAGGDSQDASPNSSNSQSPRRANSPEKAPQQGADSDSSAENGSPQGSLHVVPLSPASPQLVADALNDSAATEQGKMACAIAKETLSGLDIAAADCFATATALHIRAPIPEGSREERLVAEAQYQFLAVIAGGAGVDHFDAPPVKWIIVGHPNAALCLATPAASARDDIHAATQLAARAQKENTTKFNPEDFDRLEGRMVRDLRKVPCLAGPGSTSAQ